MVAPFTDKGNNERRSGFMDKGQVLFGALRAEVTLSHINGDANQAVEIAVLEFTREI